MKQKVYYETLTSAMKKEVYAWIQAHNLKFYGQRRSHPGRIKTADTTCLFNILRAWSVQAARAANAGQLVTNIVFINNVDMAPSGTDKTNTGRYLGKLVSARLVGGRRATEDSPLRYQDQFQVARAKGFGWEPLKRHHGAKQPYEILLNPMILPLQALPPETIIQLYDHFPMRGSTAVCIPDSSPPAEHMVESFHLLKEQREAFKAKELMERRAVEGGQKASLEATALLEEAQRQAQKAREIGAGTKDASGEVFHPKAEKEGPFSSTVVFPDGTNQVQSRLPVPPGPAEGAGEEKLGVEVLSEHEILKGGLPLLARLQLQGKELQVMAITLIWSYLNKLATAMKDREGRPRKYLSSCVHVGYRAILRVLLTSPNPQQTYDRLTAVIDRVQQRILHDPKTAYAAPPNLFFDPEYDFGYKWWDKHYLLPWERMKAQFDDFKLMGEKVSREQKERDLWLSQRSSYAVIAYSIKKWAMIYHPGDHRLRSADLLKWSIHIRLLIEKDKVPYGRAYEVAKWMMTSGDAKAKYWREGFAGFGIRSASGFRKRYQRIESDYAKLRAARRVAVAMEKKARKDLRSYG